MAKYKKKKIFSNRILTIAGLFTAGSIVGSSVNFDSLLEFDYTIPFVQVSDVEENTSPDDGSETEWDTIQVPTVPAPQEEVIVPEVTVTEPSVQEDEELPPEQPVPEQPVPEYPVTEPPIVTEPTLQEKIPDALPEPEPAPVPSEDWRNDDWMEAIFIPEEQPESVPTTSNDWMEKAEEFTQFDSISSSVSSMTPELAGMLEGIAVFWTSSGEKIHLNPSCRSFETNTVRYAGTLEEAQMVHDEGWCKLCAEYLTGTDNSEFYIEGNIYSSKEILLNSYTYSDYCNGIPAN